MKPADNIHTPKGPPKLTDGHEAALVATDVFCGGLCVYSLILATITWLNGTASWHAPVAIAGFLVANVVISQVSLRASNPYKVEIFRAISGSILVPTTYVLVDGPVGPWWPGAVIMSLGGTIVLSLLSQRALWGRLLSVYYVGLLAITHYVAIDDPDWFAFATEIGVLAMVGLLFAGIMSQLGKSLQEEHERGIELARTRDALFAEMEVAQEIQTLLLPRTPAVKGLTVAGRMVPASEVGGDYYDILNVAGENGRTFVAIGDVSGHGVSSGLTMMMARASLMGAIEANPTASLAELYCTLNRCICESLSRMDLDMYMTFGLLEHLGEGRFVAVGRHLPILINRRVEKRVDEIDLEGAWLGMLEDLTPEMLPCVSFELAPEDMLVLYTDGVVEHGSDETEMFGPERFARFIEAASDKTPEDLIDSVMSALSAHEPVQDDDVTLLVLRRND